MGLRVAGVDEFERVRKRTRKSLVDNLPDWPELEEKLAKGLSPKQGIEFTVTLDPKKSSMRQVILRKVKELVNDRYTVVSYKRGNEILILILNDGKVESRRKRK